MSLVGLSEKNSTKRKNASENSAWGSIPWLANCGSAMENEVAAQRGMANRGPMVR